MKKILLGGLFLTFFAKPVFAGDFQEFISKSQGSQYGLFGIGPMIPAVEYGGDARFFFHLEYGKNVYAIPLNFSFGNSTFILGFKPRFQYWIKPIPQLKNFSFAPGIGFIFNYWSANSMSQIELGIQLGMLLRYYVVERLHLDFSPFTMDLNFWRANFDGPESSNLGSFYFLMFGAGYDF